MDSIDIFIGATERLLKSVFLNSETEIRAFLNALPADERLAETLKLAEEGFDYDKELEAYFIAREKISDKSNVALMTRTLYKISSGELPLPDFLDALYKDTDIATAYGNFLKEYVMPYAESFVNLLKSVPENEETEPLNPNNPQPLAPASGEVYDILREIAAKVSAKNLLDREKRDIISLLSGLSDALQKNDRTLARVAYLGLCNTLMLYGAVYVSRTETKADEEFMKPVERLRSALVSNGVI